MTAYNFPNGLSEFHKTIYKIVDDPSSDPLISWSKSNNSFVIWNLEEFLRSNIPSRFFCIKLSEFLYELKIYGFRRIKKNGAGDLEFGNKDFVRGHPERLRNMMLRACRKRRTKVLALLAAKDAADRFKKLQV